MSRIKFYTLFSCIYFFFNPACSAQVASLGGSAGGSGGQISPNIPPIIAQKNVTIIYNTQTGQPDSVVLDANNLNDPSFNQPGTRQVSVPAATYNAIPDAATFQNYMATAIISDVAAQAVSTQ